MDRNSMHIQSANQHLIHNINEQQPFPLYSSVSRSNGIQYCYERPMMLNTWTQTSNADLGFSDNYLQNIYIEEQKQREKELLQKIHDLETKLRIQSDILSQSSSGRRRSHSQKPRSPQEIVNQIPVQMHENHPQLIQRQQQEQYTTTQFQVYNTQISPRNVHCEELPQTQKSPQQRPEPHPLDQNNTHTQYMVHNPNIGIQNQDGNTIQSGRPRKVNYTIIADGSTNGHDGPIEIEIAEEENILNLNGSADSERLEICFAEEQPQSLANENYIKFDNDAEQNLAKEIPQQNSVTPCSSAKQFKMPTENVSQYPVHKNCESHANTSTATVSSQAVIQYPDSQNCEMSEKRQSIAANANHSKFRANGGKIKNNRHKESAVAVAKSDLNSYTSIGPNNTLVPNKIFDNINWNNPSIATRKLLMALFDRQTLASHSMTGRPSPAFKKENKPLKDGLDPLITQDIIFAVSRRCRVSKKDVRNSITTKCADENKMWKLAQAKLKSHSEKNKENVA